MVRVSTGQFVRIDVVPPWWQDNPGDGVRGQIGNTCGRIPSAKQQHVTSLDIQRMYNVSFK